jgi:hypothetical protein
LRRADALQEVAHRVRDSGECIGVTATEMPERLTGGAAKAPLYTPEQRRRRDDSRWTLVQGILAPLQFLVFLVSLGLVLRFLVTGNGYGAAR